MRILTAQNMTGKTTAGIRWVAAEPERRALLVATFHEVREVERLARRLLGAAAAGLVVLTVAQLGDGRSRGMTRDVWVDDIHRVLPALLQGYGLTAAAGTVEPGRPLNGSREARPEPAPAGMPAAATVTLDEARWLVEAVTEVERWTIGAGQSPIKEVTEFAARLLAHAETTE